MVNPKLGYCLSSDLLLAVHRFAMAQSHQSLLSACMHTIWLSPKALMQSDMTVPVGSLPFHHPL